MARTKHTTRTNRKQSVSLYMHDYQKTYLQRLSDIHQISVFDIIAYLIDLDHRIEEQDYDLPEELINKYRPDYSYHLTQEQLQQIQDAIEEQRKLTAHRFAPTLEQVKIPPSALRQLTIDQIEEHDQQQQQLQQQQDQEPKIYEDDYFIIEDLQPTEET